MTSASEMPQDERTARAASYRFGHFELLPVQRSLRANDRDVSVTPRAFDLLLALVERAGCLVSKNELLDLVWPKLVVEENSLQVQISALRKVLGRQAIVTVPGRGYQFALLPANARFGFAQTPPSVLMGTAKEALPIGNLPAHLPPLYGRVEDAAALARMIELHPVVSVVGPGGIGKTRLAQAVAHGLRECYVDGVWLAEMAPLTAADQVVPTLARVLGQAPAPEGTALDSLVDAIRSQHLLLVLDNCEHLTTAVCELAVRIAGGAPHVHLLVTSQEPLRIPDEHIHRLDALAVPPPDDAASALDYGAVELFVARAQAADPRFAVNADSVGAIVEICTRLDGMPLAVELAAARVPLLGVHGVRQRLDERFKLLVGGGARTALRRHHTLRATLEWSYALLSSEERKVLDRLGVFVGSFSLEAAQRLASDDAIDAWAVIDHLAALVDKSWVLVDSGHALRYRMLDSSRAFALERLGEQGVIEAARRRHAQAIADTLVAGDMIEASGARIQRIGPDLDNARAAVVWATGPGGDAEIAIALAGATHHLWEAQGCNEEGDWLHRTVEPWVDEQVSPRLAARFWFAVSNLGLFTGLDRQAEAGLRAANLFRSLGDRYWLFRSLLSAAQKMTWVGRCAAAELALSEAKQLLDPCWPSCTHAFLEHGLGTFEYFAAADPGDARKHFEATRAIGRQSGDDGFLEDVADFFLAMIDFAQGDFATAAERGLQTLHRPVRRMGARNRTILRGTLGAALASLGRMAEADAMLRVTLPQARRAVGSTTWLFNHVAFLVARQGRCDAAAKLLGYIDAAPTAGVIAKSPSQRRSYAEALALTESAIDAEDFSRLHAAGGELNESDATALAFPTERQGAQRAR